MDQANDLIDQETVGKNGILAGIAFFEPGADDIAAIFKHSLETF